MRDVGGILVGGQGTRGVRRAGVSALAHGLLSAADEADGEGNAGKRTPRIQSPADQVFLRSRDRRPGVVAIRVDVAARRMLPPGSPGKRRLVVAQPRAGA
jgi:hypothetical protein